MSICWDSCSKNTREQTHNEHCGKNTPWEDNLSLCVHEQGVLSNNCSSHGHSSDISNQTTCQNDDDSFIEIDSSDLESVQTDASHDCEFHTLFNHITGHCRDEGEEGKTHTHDCDKHEKDIENRVCACKTLFEFLVVEHSVLEIDALFL